MTFAFLVWAIATVAIAIWLDEARVEHGNSIGWHLVVCGTIAFPIWLVVAVTWLVARGGR